MRRALVLNATYEPLSIVSARRAVCLLIADKADLVEADDAVIRSATLTIGESGGDPAALHGQGAATACCRRVAAGRVQS